MDQRDDEVSPDTIIAPLLARALAGSADRHFDLDELRGLVADRRANAGAWVLPPHLSRCQLCLETFEILLDGPPAASDSAIDRFVRCHQPERSKLARFPEVALKLAALAAAIVTAVWLTARLGEPSPALVREGIVALDGGRVLGAGAALPRGAMFTAAGPVRAEFGDGSSVTLGKSTRTSFGASMRGGPIITLTEGEVVAVVAKQPEFIVRTPLGDVTVVGTRFSVTCHSENVVVYESVGGGDSMTRKDSVRVVRVEVFDGVVRVRRLNEDVLVAAPRTAVLRGNEPGIELSGERQ